MRSELLIYQIIKTNNDPLNDNTPMFYYLCLSVVDIQR
nr:MAG TPA: hypothetical protein [Caudoviricetes sp.]